MSARCELRWPEWPSSLSSSSSLSTSTSSVSGQPRWQCCAVAMLRGTRAGGDRRLRGAAIETASGVRGYTTYTLLCGTDACAMSCCGCWCWGQGSSGRRNRVCACVRHVRLRLEIIGGTPRLGEDTPSRGPENSNYEGKEKLGKPWWRSKVYV